MAEMKFKVESTVTVSPEVERMRSSFWRGFAFSVFLTSMFQDWMGLERYLEAARAGWREYPFWMWALLIAGLLIWQGLVERDHRRLVAKVERDYREGVARG